MVISLPQPQQEMGSRRCRVAVHRLLRPNVFEGLIGLVGDGRSWHEKGTKQLCCRLDHDLEVPQQNNHTIVQYAGEETSGYLSELVPFAAGPPRRVFLLVDGSLRHSQLELAVTRVELGLRRGNGT